MAVADGIDVAPVIAATESEVLGVNDKFQLAELEAHHRRQRAHELMIGGVTVIDVTVDDIFAAQEYAARIAKLMDVKAESWLETNAQLVNGLRSQSVSTIMISVFVVISVVFGIASVLAVSVVQRTREIGVRLAIGARRTDVRRQFLLEAAMLSGIGGAIGACVMGFGAVAPHSFHSVMSLIGL